MESIEINKYIDFDKLFMDLYNDHSDNILNYEKYESIIYKELLKFYLTAKKNFDLILDECQLTDKEIIFIYGLDFSDANESCNQSTTASYVIIFSRVDDDFTACEYEQG